MDAWGQVLFIVYALPPVIIFFGAVIARLVARWFGKRLGWWPALGIGVLALVAGLVAYVKYLDRIG